MTPIEALHTAARRYCADRSMYWRHQHSESRVAPDSEAACAFFPRYRVLEAILVEVERMTPEDFTGLEAAREWILLAGEAAQNYSTENIGIHHEVARVTMSEERARFQGFVHGFADAQANNVEPMPYRRTLSRQESDAIWAGLAERWGVGNGFWFPMSGDAPPPHTIAVRADAFEEIFGDVPLRSLLAELGVTRIFALSESGSYDDEYEIDLPLLNAYYTGLEAFWAPRDWSWVIYASHENSLTFAGERLVEALKARWTEWDQHLYLP